MKRFLSIRHLLVVAMLVLAGTLVLVISQRYTRVQPADDETVKENADVSLANIDYTETRDGRAFWRLRADNASYDLASKQSRLKNVSLNFFGDGKFDPLSLKARQGLWNETTGELEVFGDVVASGEKGYRLLSERLHYRQSERLLWTDGPVVLQSGQFDVHATGMRLLVDQRKLKLLAKVRSRWRVQALKEDKG